jgi:polyisoprenoid-binding protein YceI
MEVSRYFMPIYGNKLVAYITTILLLIFVPFLLKAQPYSLNSQSSKMIVAGTSTLHDWEIESSTMTGSAQMSANPSADDLTISALTFTIGGETLKSGKGGMDKNTYAALETKAFPKITYKLSKVISCKKVNRDFQISTEGELTIAGSTQPVVLNATVQILPNGSITIVGSKVMTMTTFGIDPPTALMGTIKTGDEITVKFNVNYAKQ